MLLLSQIQVIEDDKANKGSEPFVTGVRGQAPPLVTTNFHVKDQGKRKCYSFPVDEHYNTSHCAACMCKLLSCFALLDLSVKYFVCCTFKRERESTLHPLHSL